MQTKTNKTVVSLSFIASKTNWISQRENNIE